MSSFGRIIAIILTGFLAIYSGTQIFNWSKISTLHKVLSSAGVLGVVLLTGYGIKDYFVGVETEKVKATFGEIRSKKERPPMKSIDINIRGSKSTLAFYGDGKNDVLNLADLFDLGVGNDLLFTVDENRLYVKTTVRDEKGVTIAQLDGTYWTLYNTSYDYNYDECGFEVVTPNKRVVFQIDLVGKEVQLAGLIISEQLNGVFFMPSPDGGAVMIPIRKGMGEKKPFELTNVLKPMFKYPRQRFLGKRTKASP